MISTAGDFFIVDNSDEHWKALEYLRQWSSISKGLDVATGHFEIGSLLALDGEWQKIDKIRLLIGGETSRRTVEAVRAAASELDDSLANERSVDPFLSGLPAIVDAMRSGQIEVKVYKKKKFHAKAYITHSTLEVVGSAALVGSSNFTRPGLTQNVELNVRFTGAEVRELQEWYEEYWNDAELITEELLDVISRYAAPPTPFEVYCRALKTLTENVSPGDHEWESEHSRIYGMLAPYQRDAYLGMKQRASQWGGGFVTDGVGLGKTFVGLMLAEYYAVKEGKNVLIFATKTGKEAVWDPEIKKYLPQLQGEFTNLRVMAHTDLSTKDAMEKVRALAERADVVIIDEAHNFRNRGTPGPDPDNPQSRWARMQRICQSKTVFMLTATPINNSLFDLVHEIQLFTGDNDHYFSDLGIHSLRHYINTLERSFDPGGQHGAIDMDDFDELLERDKLLESLIVQNSRKYAVESSRVNGEATVRFPEQSLPRAVPYDYDLNYSALLHELADAFQRNQPLFILPMYYPLAYSKDPEVDRLVENRQRQVVGLIRTVFLKRFESSLAAFTGSLIDMADRITVWIHHNTTPNSEANTALLQWEQSHKAVLADLRAAFRSSAQQAGELEEDENLGEESEYEDTLDPAHYDMDSLLRDALSDLNQIGRLLDQCQQVGLTGDTKYEQLRRLLVPPVGKGSKNDDEVFAPVFQQQKVLVFTEFADTARYLEERLKRDGLVYVDRLDGSRKANRVEMIKRFAPFYNGVDEEARTTTKPLRVLISTDVLSEGVNLQDATLIVNYDIHWNPVRLMQRIGRIDRRLNEDIESEIVADDPTQEKTRGRIEVRNFLPNDELNSLLTLYRRVQSRVLRISKTLGIPGGKLLSEEDLYDDVKVFHSFLDEYQGQMSPLEQLRLKYLSLLADDPDLEQRIHRLPVGAFAAKSGQTSGTFICHVEATRIHVDDEGTTEWSLTPGRPAWSLVTSEGAITDLLAIDAAIACEPNDSAIPIANPVSAGTDLHRFIDQRQDQLLKGGMPLTAPSPQVSCWMEVQ